MHTTIITVRNRLFKDIPGFFKAPVPGFWVALRCGKVLGADLGVAVERLARLVFRDPVEESRRELLIVLRRRERARRRDRRTSDRARRQPAREHRTRRLQHIQSLARVGLSPISELFTSDSQGQQQNDGLVGHVQFMKQTNELISIHSNELKIRFTFPTAIHLGGAVGLLPCDLSLPSVSLKKRFQAAKSEHHEGGRTKRLATRAYSIARKRERTAQQQP
jgi:hypothetical protein